MFSIRLEKGHFSFKQTKSREKEKNAINNK